MDSSIDKKEELRQQLRAAALEYHQFPSPGKIAVTPTKSVLNQRDLALAYSPGVAAPCEEIVKDPSTAYKYTARGNLVAVISNGTAVLGLGNIGPLASKPVMEGKGVLFKKFAGIDVFDIEINETDPDKLIEVIAALEPTFGGVNLEDIKAPECFYIERKLRERMKIPVFHDDQHGTAIIVGAAILNGLKVVGKDLKKCKMVVSGAGAAALACLDLAVDLGFPIENIYVTDLAGVVYKGRTELMDPDKERFAQDTPHRTLAEIIPDADIFLGLSAGGVLKPEMVAKMAPNPLILALANPNPEILPEDAKAVRDDVIIATGRSDYPNQVNNVLCFPYMFRGALDCGATTITREMEIAVVHAIADLAHAEQSDIVASAYGISNLSFGPEYLIPMPFDPRLLTHIAPAVAKAAMDGGVATRPIADLAAYAESLQQFVYRSGSFMKPLFQIAKSAPAERKRIVFAEGEEERVLRAVQVVVDENLARPILVGRPAVLEKRIEKFGLRLKQGKHFDVINPDFDERYRDYWQSYHQMVMRKGVTEDLAKLAMRRRHTLIGAMMIHKGDADGMICGTYGTTDVHLQYIEQVLGKRAGSNVYAALNFIITQERQIAMVDTHVNENPTAEELAEITLMASEELERLGITPRVALLSHSNFGTSNSASAKKMRAALGLIQQKAPNLEVDGEMHGDTALDAKLRAKIMPQSTLKGDANLLVMPNIEAANIAYNVVKTAAGSGVAIGPVLLGCARPVHILTPSATVRRIVNMTALCVVDAVSER
ncbi:MULTISPECIES: NADP-dependent malic enzyme [Massilia]|uniref:NADP-dependent malic enzyme n=2 Tax=Massilia TaxID=149698 RepID=A0A7X3G0H3_9BURK|nr:MULTISPECIES: NADP-dependent malic enzyme [Telluria group]KQY16584.1 malate dehydrogenase [Massilia sp. Root133]KQZ51883.1 malate dehydrogenase [Massilia sp. Root1485]MDN4046423.1 NADP-dependent malic enzyme [Massilia sp. YIM B02787]MVW61431.1 NADP-dependent malic enzyme [Telluria cellulosilytica]